MERLTICIILILTCLAAHGQESAMSLVQAAALLSGAGSEEELTEDALEPFEHLARHPVALNTASAEKLVSCGLLSPYQAASLCDYRERCGCVLSFAELATVNGFDAGIADALKLFSTLSGTENASAGKKRCRQDLLLRRSYKDGDCSTGLKYVWSLEGKAEFFCSARETGTVSLALYPGRGLRLIAGDFNARLGQGLLLWSGFSTGGFPTVDAFVRRAGGFSPTGSFSPGMRGIALESGFGGWTLRFGSSIYGPGAILSASRRSRSAEYGMQAISGPDGRRAASFDWKAGLGKILFFGEAAFAGGSGARPACAWTGGLQYCPAYRTKAVISGRYYPSSYPGSYSAAVRTGSKVSDEAGVAAGIQWRWLGVTADAVHQEARGKRQLKTVVRASPEIESAAGTFSPTILWTERRNEGKGRSRSELRADLRWQSGRFTATLRADCTRSLDSGALLYLEPGYRTGNDQPGAGFSVFLRGTLFRIDNWDDRIYASCRDVPGAFSVPAYYGRGREFAMYAGGWLRRGRRRHSLWLRASCLRYEKGQTRSPRDEIKLQYMFKW